jgi:hypothetical protein
MPTGKQWDRQGKVLRGSDVQKPQPFGAAVFYCGFFYLSVLLEFPQCFTFALPSKSLPARWIAQVASRSFFTPLKTIFNSTADTDASKIPL